MAAADFIKSLVPGAQNVYKNIMFSPALSLLKDVLKVGTAQVDWRKKRIIFWHKRDI